MKVWKVFEDFMDGMGDTVLYVMSGLSKVWEKMDG